MRAEPRARRMPPGLRPFHASTNAPAARSSAKSAYSLRRAGMADRRRAVRVDAVDEDVLGRDLGHELVDARAHPVLPRAPHALVVDRALEEVVAALLERHGHELQPRVDGVLRVGETLVVLAVQRHALRQRRRDVRLRPSDVQDVVRDNRHRSCGNRAAHQHALKVDHASSAFAKRSMPSRFVRFEVSRQLAHGAIMKPLRRAAEMFSRQNFTRPAMLLFTAGPSFL